MDGSAASQRAPGSSDEARRNRAGRARPSEGHEQKGLRPVLIGSPEAFNQVTRVPVAVRITSGGSFAGTAGFAVSRPGAGTQTTGVNRCGQPRALDLRARGGKRLETVPATIMDEVLAGLVLIFE